MRRFIEIVVVIAESDGAKVPREALLQLAGLPLQFFFFCKMCLIPLRLGPTDFVVHLSLLFGTTTRGLTAYAIERSVASKKNRLVLLVIAAANGCVTFTWVCGSGGDSPPFNFSGPRRKRR